MLSEKGILCVADMRTLAASVAAPRGDKRRALVPISGPPRQLDRISERGDNKAVAAPMVTHDSHLVAHLQDPSLRRLCTCAAGLSAQAQWRLEAVAEALRNTE
jgi:hypothetical protein